MTQFETAIFWMLMVSPLVIPLVVFACVKLATGAFYRTRQRFYYDSPQERKVQNDDSRKA